MAITTITPTQMVFNSSNDISQGAGTAINPANTMEIPYPQQGKLLVVIDSDHADTEVTFSASDFGVQAGHGDLSVAVANSEQKLIMLNTARFKYSNGNIKMSWAANSAGFVKAYYLPV